MTERQGTNETDVLAVPTSYELSALVNILERKGFMTKAEFLEELARLRTEVRPPVDPDPYVLRG